MHGQIGNSHMWHDGRYKYLHDVSDGTNLCFDTEEDPNDLRPLEGQIPQRLREALRTHLAADGHEHAVDGEIANLKMSRPPINQLRAKPVAGLGAAQYLSTITCDILDIH